MIVFQANRVNVRVFDMPHPPLGEHFNPALVEGVRIMANMLPGEFPLYSNFCFLMLHDR